MAMARASVVYGPDLVQPGAVLTTDKKSEHKQHDNREGDDQGHLHPAGHAGGRSGSCVGGAGFGGDGWISHVRVSSGPT
jgi:hypothetical protein